MEGAVSSKLLPWVSGRGEATQELGGDHGEQELVAGPPFLEKQVGGLVRTEAGLCSYLGYPGFFLCPGLQDRRGRGTLLHPPPPTQLSWGTKGKCSDLGLRWGRGCC
jgi:hypothetical protein